MIKKGLIALIFVYFTAVPQFAEAQFTDEAEYRAYLFALIELLQQQVAMLVEQQADLNSSEPLFANAEETDFTSFLLNDSSELVAWYRLAKPGTTDGVDNTYKNLFDRFFEIVPGDYDDYFLELVIYEDREDDFDGFVETVTPFRADTWRLGVSESILRMPSAVSVEDDLFIHEFAHIVSYEGIPGRDEPKNTTCHEFFSDLGCPPANSYLTDFIDTFWSESKLDRLVSARNPESIWTRRELRDNFVSDYAATNPAEDFAESFTYFVLEEEPVSDTVSDTKINYFYSQPKMLEIRAEILNKL